LKIRLIYVRWREGEDLLEIDLDNIRMLNQEELLIRDKESYSGAGVTPFIDNYNWLDCIFIEGMENQDGYCVKIIQHLGSWE